MNKVIINHLKRHLARLEEHVQNNDIVIDIRIELAEFAASTELLIDLLTDENEL